MVVANARTKAAHAGMVVARTHPATCYVVITCEWVGDFRQMVFISHLDAPAMILFH